MCISVAGNWLITMGDNTGSCIRFAQLLARICHLHDGQLRDTQMCHVGDKLSCNTVYRTIIVMQKAHWSIIDTNIPMGGLTIKKC